MSSINRFNIPICDVDIYLSEGIGIYNNCIYVSLDCGRGRYIGYNRFGIVLNRDYKIEF